MPVVGHPGLVAGCKADSDAAGPYDEVGVGGFGLGLRDGLEAVGRGDGAGMLVEGGSGAGLTVSAEHIGLSADFGAYEGPGDLHADIGGRGEGLGAAETGVVASRGADGDEDATRDGVQLGDTDPDVIAPGEGVERDAAGMAEDQQLLDGSFDPRKAAGAAVFANAVVDDEMATFDLDPEPVSIRDKDGRISWFTPENFRERDACPATGTLGLGRVFLDRWGQT